MAKCLACGSDNNDDANFCRECGEKLDENSEEEVKSIHDETLNSTEKGVKGIIPALKGWWDKRSTKGKGVTICCLGILLIGLIGSMSSSDHTNSTVASQTNNSDSAVNDSTPDPQPKEVTISQLYSNSVEEDTYVKVTGTVQDTDGSMMRLRNSNYDDIYVFGSDLNAYENKKVTVVGYYDGPFSFTTVMGGSRTIPSIRYATII